MQATLEEMSDLKRRVRLLEGLKDSHEQELKTVKVQGGRRVKRKRNRSSAMRNFNKNICVKKALRLVDVLLRKRKTRMWFTEDDSNRRVHG